MSSWFRSLTNHFYGVEDEALTEKEVEVQTSVSIGDQLKQLKIKQKECAFKAGKLEKAAHDAHKRGKKTEALALLKQKKMYDQRALQLGGQITNLEQTHMVMDSTATASDMVAVMRQTSATMTAQMSGLSVEEVQTVREDLQDLTTEAAEISSILADPLGLGYDDGEGVDDLMAQWDEEARVTETEDVMSQLPDAPRGELSDNRPSNDNSKVANE